MQRYFLYFAYDGTNYHGWQVQPNAVTVQQQIEYSLSLLLRVKTEVVGAGRTDTGVHARMMVAHFDDPRSEESRIEPLDCANLVYKLNKVLPPDISVYGIYPVVSDAHARFHATARTYYYYLYVEKNPFVRSYACRSHAMLDFQKMNKAATSLLRCDDFTSFSKLHTDAKTNLCRITKAEWSEVETGLWRFEITADRFLRNMVRAIVGTLMEVGRGKITVEDFAAIIEAKNRCSAGESMPGNALFLVDVVYPDKIFISGKAPMLHNIIK